jgi:tetratricopeptide (TPR) repeat protein
VAARLDDRFRLLTGGSRTAMPRHHTLRAVVGWSWDLLDDDERALARRLAVFPAGISLEAAEWVGAPAGGVLDTLTALVDKSLLHTEDDDEPRFRMLETIRDYGLQRLAETGDAAAVRAAHAAYFVHVAEAAEPHLVTPEQLRWIRRLMAEHDNLLAALHFACDTGDAATAVRLGAALGLFWTIRGNHAEAASRLRLALDVPGPAPQEPRTLASALYLFNAVLAGGQVHAQTAADESRAHMHGAGGAVRHPAPALIDAVLALVTEDTAEGLAAIDRRLPHPDPWERAMLRLIRALINGNGGDMAAMGRDLDAAVTAFREAGERWGLATSLTYLASVRAVFGEFDSAIVGLQEAIGLLRELDPDDDTVLQRVWIADARRQQGDAEGARSDLLEVIAPASGMPPAPLLAFARIRLGDLARYDGDLDEAARQYGAAAEDLGREPSTRRCTVPCWRRRWVTSRWPVATRRSRSGICRWPSRWRSAPRTCRWSPSSPSVWRGCGSCAGPPPRRPRCSAPRTRCGVRPTPSPRMSRCWSTGCGVSSTSTRAGPRMTAGAPAMSRTRSP